MPIIEPPRPTLGDTIDPTRGPRPPVRPPRPLTARPPENHRGCPWPMPSRWWTEAAGRLWTPEGAAALAYLRGRGLTDATIKPPASGGRLGCRFPSRRDKILGVSGIVIPWLDARPAWRWSRSDSPWVASRNMPKRSATAPQSFRHRRSFGLACRWSIVEGEFDCSLAWSGAGGPGRRRDAWDRHRPDPRHRYPGRCWPPPSGISRMMLMALATRPPRVGPPEHFESGPRPRQGLDRGLSTPDQPTPLVDRPPRGDRGPRLFDLG